MLLLIFLTLTANHIILVLGQASSLQVINESGRPVRIQWLPEESQSINGARQDSKTVLLTKAPLEVSGTFSIQARAGHVFRVEAVQVPVQVQVQASVETEPLEFTHQPGTQHTVTVTANWTLHMANPQQEEAQGMLQECQASNRTLRQCVQDKLAQRIRDTRQDMAHHRTLFKKHGSHWEDFACEDYQLETSPPVRQTQWFYPVEQDYYQVDILHEQDTSQIHVIHEFVDPEECQAALQVSQDDLYRAKVHDGQGGHKFSKHRKAWQANIKVHWELEEDGDYIARLSRRVYDYTNHVLGLNLQEEGQEDLMMIQYHGQGLDSDQPPDRYMPHCDGPCHGRPLKRASRMATMVMYWYVK